MTWTLYEGDNLAIMPTIQDKSIDLIIIDPPYNIGKAEWDKIPDYVEWLGARFKECERVLKDNGSFYFFHNDMPQIAQLMEWLRQNARFVFKSLITVDKKDNAFVIDLYGAQEHFRNYLNLAEYCLFYTFQDETGLEVVTEQHIKPRHPFAKYLQEEFERAGVTRKELAALFLSKTGGLTGCISNWLNGDNVITEEQYNMIRDYLNRGSGNYLRREYEDLRREYEAARYPFNEKKGRKNVWEYRFRENTKQEHPTQKPVNLIEYIVGISSNKGDTVLDCFAGSGTTGIAAENLGRNVVMIEKDAKYCNIIRKRMANRQTTIFEEGVT